MNIEGRRKSVYLNILSFNHPQPQSTIPIHNHQTSTIHNLHAPSNIWVLKTWAMATLGSLQVSSGSTHEHCIPLKSNSDKNQTLTKFWNMERDFANVGERMFSQLNPPVHNHTCAHDHSHRPTAPLLAPLYNIAPLWGIWRVSKVLLLKMLPVDVTSVRKCTPS